MNEYLMKDREGLSSWVSDCKKLALSKTDVELEMKREEFEREAVAYSLSDFVSQLRASREGKEIPTGFEELDKILDGGLYPGLYVIGAISSLGKTTLALQIADQIGVINKRDAADANLTLSEQLASGKVVIIAPEGFLEHAVSENVYAGFAMSRRAQYQYGTWLKAGEKGTMSIGIGLGQASGGTMKKLPEKADVEGKNLVFAERFASLRKSRGLTQRAIAEKLGITDRAVSKWETGRGTPKFSDTPILASIFGVTTDYLFGCEKR